MSYTCSNPWTTLFVWGNGDVTHCCYSNIGSLGNINKQSVDEIWSSDKLKRVRNNITEGNYIKAGCEHFCRPYRWNRYYGGQEHVQPIPEGLGRIANFDKNKTYARPAIIGMAMDWRCNFKCTHCQAPRDVKGLSQKNIDKLWPYVEKSSIVRFVDGEFTINRKTLEQMRAVSKLVSQPTVFMNTNGHIGIDQYLPYIENIQSFHLKFSLEGIGSDFERVRVGGKWLRFEKNLLNAKEIFDKKKMLGQDWRLYLNFCVMRSNFGKLPDVVQFAIDKDIAIVLNPINGMRHIDENISMYEHLMIMPAQINKIVNRVHQLLDQNSYHFSGEVKSHLDYIIHVFTDKKLNIPYPVLSYIRKFVHGQQADRLLYILYKWRLDKKACAIYVYRKLEKQLRYNVPELFRKTISSINRLRINKNLTKR